MICFSANNITDIRVFRKRGKGRQAVCTMPQLQLLTYVGEIVKNRLSFTATFDYLNLNVKRLLCFLVTHGHRLHIRSYPVKQ